MLTKAFSKFLLETLLIDVLNSGSSLITPKMNYPIRPGADATCSASIGGGASIDITTLDLTGGETVVLFMAGPDGTVV